MTNAQFSELPNTDELANVAGVALASIGVGAIEGAAYGNYEKTGSVVIELDGYVVTDIRKLIISFSI